MECAQIYIKIKSGYLRRNTEIKISCKLKVNRNILITDSPSANRKQMARASENVDADFPFQNSGRLS